MEWKQADDSMNIQKLKRPQGKIHLVIDSDAYNEIDDQYAISYALKKPDIIQIDAIYAVPFISIFSDSTHDGMEKSYDEIKKLIKMLHREDLAECVYKGSTDYLVDENTPQESEAARDLVKRALAMPEGELLYVAAIGAITNVASALLMAPEIAEKIVVVWLGGHAYHWKDTREFNMRQDVAAVRVVFDSGVPLVQIPCNGVTSHLLVTEPELRERMKGKGEICDYLYQITCNYGERVTGKYWSKVIWDIAVLVWLVGPKNCTTEHLTHSPIVSYDCHYSVDTSRHLIKVVDSFNRDVVFEELFTVLQQ